MILELVILAARLLLATIFAVAALTKLADHVGARRALLDFGVPAQLSAPLSVLLPLSELAVAAALLSSRTAVWGGIGALVLLLIFSLAIGVNLTRGRRPDCRCFGQLQSGPVGWSTLARNGALAALAILVSWQGQLNPSLNLLSWASNVPEYSTAGLVISIVLGMLVFESWLLFHLLRQNGRLLWRVEALEARLDGSAPGFRLASLEGGSVTLEALRALGKPILLVFTDPNCGPCHALLPEVGAWQRTHKDKMTLVLISRGTLEQNYTSAAEHGIRAVLLQQDDEVAEAYGVAATPSAVLVRPDGMIGSRVAAGADSIRALLAHALDGNTSNTHVRAVPERT